MVLRLFGKRIFWSGQVVWRRRRSALFQTYCALHKSGRRSDGWAVGPFFIFAMII